MRAENASDGDDDWSAVGSHGLDCFLILGPKPGSDGFFNVFQRFFFVPTLRDAAGQRRTLRDDPAVF